MPPVWTKASLAKTIDQTLLKAIATADLGKELCAEARKFGFLTVCVNPVWVPLCVKELAGSNVLVSTVIGFPLGANRSDIKAEEARRAVADGAAELEMVINIGAAKFGDWRLVEEDIKAVASAAGGRALLKVIIETCYLSDLEKVRACEAASRAGAHFIATSTGFGTGGATAEDITLMKKALGGKLKIKASGDIRSYHDAIRMLDAGADRIGASSGVSIVSELVE